MKLVIVTECEVPEDEIETLMGFLVGNFKRRVPNIQSIHAAIEGAAEIHMAIVNNAPSDVVVGLIAARDANAEQ